MLGITFKIECKQQWNYQLTEEHNWKGKKKKKVLVAVGTSMFQLISHMGHLLLARSSQTTFGESE